MAWIEGRVRTDVAKALDRLAGPVKLVLFTSTVDCEMCDDTEALLRELTALSDRLTLEVHNRLTEPDVTARYGVDKSPALVLEGPAGARVRYYGIPAGYEFASLLEGLADAAAGGAELSADSRARLAELDKPVRVQVFVTPTCPHCPGAVRAAHRIAVASPHVTADSVEATEFPDLARRYGVRGVPQVVVNDTVAFVGNRGEAALVDAILKAAA